MSFPPSVDPCFPLKASRTRDLGVLTVSGTKGWGRSPRTLVWGWGFREGQDVTPVVLKEGQKGKDGKREGTFQL